MMRKRKRRYADVQTDRQIDPIIRLWALRILFPAGGHRQFVESQGGFDDMAIAEAIGLNEYLNTANQDPFDLDKRQSLRILEKFHADY